MLGLREVSSIAKEVKTDVFDTVGFDESGKTCLMQAVLSSNMIVNLSIDGRPLI